jgi:hypothetical protein
MINKHLIDELPCVSPQFYVVSSDGCEAFDLGDEVHAYFAPAGMMELGKRYAKKMFELIYSYKL